VPRKIAALLLVLGLVLLGWLHVRSARATRQAQVVAWLECGECLDGERAAVRGQGNWPVSALSLALLDGPGPNRRANVRRRMELTYPTGASLPQTEYVALGLQGYVETYQRRAAIALADIAEDGSTSARQALASALDSANAGSRAFPASVLRTLSEETARAAAAAFTGQLVPTTASFLDTVTVHLAAGQVVDDDDVALVGSPFGDSVLIDRWPGSDSLRFVAMGDVGTYTVLIRRLGVAQDSAQAPFTIGAMPDRPQGLGAQHTVPLGQLPYRHYFAVRDSSEQIRLAPGAPMAMGFDLAWRDSVGVRLIARGCTAPFGVVALPLDPTRAVRGRVVDDAGGPVGGAEVRLPSVIGATVSSAQDGSFDLAVPAGPDSIGVRVTHADHVTAELTLPIGLGDIVIEIPRRSRAAAPGVVRALRVSAGTFPAGCWLVGVERRDAPPDARATLFRFGVNP
jgi:hypothetical protein